MNLRTHGRGRECWLSGSNKHLSSTLAVAIIAAVLVSSGCEISIDRASSEPSPTEVAQTDKGAEASHPGTESPEQVGSPADRPTTDSPNPDLQSTDPLKPAPRTPDSPSSDPAKPTPAPPDSPNPDSPTPGTPTPETPKPAAAKPPVGPKKELLPIESTARSALAREPGIEVITFDDLNLGMQADMVFRDFLVSDRVRELDGQKVRLIGYMHGGVSQLKDLREFVLLRNTECKFGPGGLADHLVRVFMKSEPGAEYSTSAMQIDGVLKVNPFQGPDGNTWSVYDIEAQAIKVIRK